MTLNSNFLVESYLSEARIKKPIDHKDFIRRLNNLYKEYDMLGEDPPSDFISSESEKRVEVKIYDPEAFPGIKMIGKTNVDTDELEKQYLKGTGWEVIGAFAIPDTYYRTPEGYEGLRVPMSQFSISIGFEPRQVKETLEKPRYLYHAAPTELVGRILREGLKPKSRPDHMAFRYSQDRVYLFTGYDSYLMKGFISDFGEAKDFTIFEIDTKKFNRFNLYNDKSSTLLKKDGFPFSVYTKTHIPARAITVLGRRTV